MDYQNAMEEMGVRLRNAELTAKETARKLAKVCKAMAAAAQTAEAEACDEPTTTSSWSGTGTSN
jgi:hypothetical protein